MMPKAEISPRNDPETVDRLVTENIGLAYFFGHKWSWAYGRDEAMSHAMKTLLECAQRWDSAKGEFGAYATFSLRLSMKRPSKKQWAKKRGGGALHISLDAPVFIDSRKTAADVVESDTESGCDNLMAEERDEFIAGLLAALSPREREIIIRRFGLYGHEVDFHKDIAKDFGCSDNNVWQMERRILAKLRRSRNAAEVHGRTS